MNIINIGYDSSNYYLIEPDTSHLLVDVGWPGTLPKLMGVLKRKGLSIKNIRYLLVTHYHPDHAGLAQDVKELGVKLLVIDTQIPFIPLMKNAIKTNYHYHEIRLDDIITLNAKTSREFLKNIGLNGKIILTPGHSDDSISLILDEGCAFTGDLHPVTLMDNKNQRQTETSWAKIRACGVKTIYPGHGAVYIDNMR